MVLAVDGFIYQKKSWRHIFLFVASLFFYFKTSGTFFLLLLFTITIDWVLGIRISKTDNPKKKKWLLAISVVSNLLVLCYFKYAYFFTDSYNTLFNTEYHVVNWLAQWSNSFFGSAFDAGKIILPVGVSFYTFQSISYTVEVYRGNLQPLKRLTDYGFYVSFFPQLVAGPIVKATEFIPQMFRPYVLSRSMLGLGLFWILNGLVKKIFLADYIAVNFIDRIFKNPEMYSGFENLVALYGYSLQVYADFSGYTDIAIGVALLMGFSLSANFNSPYKATDLSDFWRRWHISLSSWLREYLYIPLGGNKAGSKATWIAVLVIVGFLTLLSGSWIVLWIALSSIAFLLTVAYFFKPFAHWLITNVNVMITMLIGGLWHGASWNFVIWGALNGIGLVFSKLWKKISPWKNKNKWYVRAWMIFLTFNFITLTRIWFRAGTGTTWEDFEAAHDAEKEKDIAQVILSKITSIEWHLAPEVIVGYWNIILVIVLGMVIHWLPSSFKEKYRNYFSNLPIWMLISAILITIIFIYQVLMADLHPFIYFQF
ncbi:MAG: MBOAT family O-acyltransferase [Flavobacteriales bacterium]|nr:MBOAT family O-acyltransferase [Flavobacteriales bacterium]